MTDPHTVKLDQASDGIDVSENLCYPAKRLQEVGKYLEAIKTALDGWIKREKENFTLRNQMTLDAFVYDIEGVSKLARFGALAYDEHVEETKKKMMEQVMNNNMTNVPPPQERLQAGLKITDTLLAFLNEMNSKGTVCGKHTKTEKKLIKAVLHDVRDIKSALTTGLPHGKKRSEPPDFLKAFILQMAMNGYTLNEVPPPTPSRPEHEDYEEPTSVQCQTQ